MSLLQAAHQRPDPIMEFHVVNLSDSITEDILDRIYAEDDPLDVIDSGTPPHAVVQTPPTVVQTPPTVVQTPPTVDIPPTPPADISLLPPPAPSDLLYPPACSRQAGGPRRRGRKNTGRNQIEKVMHQNYPVIVKFTLANP